MKNLSFGISDEMSGKIVKIYGNRNKGAQRIVEALPILRKSILLGLKGKFSENELKLMIDRTNGLIFNPQYSCNAKFLLMGIEDACNLDNLDEKWDVQKEELLKKIEMVTAGQVFFLADWLDCFWIIDHGKGIEKYIRELL